MYLPIYWSRQILFIKRLLYLLLFFSFTRVVFIVFNSTQFSGLSFYEYVRAFTGGVRFDYSAIYTFLIPVFILEQVPFSLLNKRATDIGFAILYGVIGVAILSFNFIDIGYFPFQKTRSGTGLFTIMFSGGEIWRLLPSYISDFWHVAVVYSATMVLFVMKMPRYQLYPLKRRTWYANSILTTVYLLSFMSASYGIVRGFGHKPLRIINALEYSHHRLVAVCLNTPFIILHTMHKEDLPETNYMEEGLREEIFPAKFVPREGAELVKKNIVILILESFSREYVGYLNHDSSSLTPNLDAILDQSVTFTNGIANGSRSIEAMPSLLSSLPQLMDETYITSKYSANCVNSFASLLKPFGYYSAFFHGGENGTMNFDKFMQIAGYDDYFGLNEYGSEGERLGEWGVPDHYYLPYTVKKMAQFPEPFTSAIFTLSSHHPYNIPLELRDSFAGDDKMLVSLQYADYALGQFFAEAERLPFYKNTLFVIAADHTAISLDPAYENIVDCAIPIAIFDPSGSFVHVEQPNPMEQIDVLPTVLGMLNFPKPFSCFGSEYSRKQANCPSLHHRNGSFLCFDADMSITVAEGEMVDSEVLDSLPEGHAGLLLNYTKAYIQIYNNRIRLNELCQ